MNSHESQDAPDPQMSVEKVLMLFRQLGRLDTTIDFEDSFKAVHSRVFQHRFLLGINRSELADTRDECLVSICENIGMPRGLCATFQQTLSEANHVYFGVEQSNETLLFKAYLEYRNKIERKLGETDLGEQSFRLFTGLKWDALSAGRHTVTRYDWYPSMPVSAIFEHLQTYIDPDRHRILWETVRGVIERAVEIVSHTDVQYLEVTEEDNPRRSFDVNIYKSGLRVEHLWSYLSTALRHYGIPSDRIELLRQKIATERFGHLAGGVDREGQDFMTVYYGARQVHSSQLATARVASPDSQR